MGAGSQVTIAYVPRGEQESAYGPRKTHERCEGRWEGGGEPRGRDAGLVGANDWSTLTICCVGVGQPSKFGLGDRGRLGRGWNKNFVVNGLPIKDHNLCGNGGHDTNVGRLHRPKDARVAHANRIRHNNRRQLGAKPPS